MKRIFILGIAFIFAGCAPVPLPPAEVSLSAISVQENPVPGTVSDFWEEPMYDMADVPAQIDPHGVYYRPRHREVVEIRPGRYQKAEYPPSAGETKQ